MLNDKVAIITGASSGIGYATALALSKAGAKVAIGARRTEKLADLENKIKENNGEAYSQKLDVTKKDECNSFVNNVLEKWGSVDILVNNAGLMPLSFVKNLKIDEWDQMIDVNIKGVLYCTGAVVSHMLEKKSGHIVNISSVAGRIVFTAGIVYF
ncbi:MAG: SDR family oxidoreductase, partial [Candidatus Nitrosomaritimum aestuariumsis]